MFNGKQKMLEKALKVEEKAQSDYEAAQKAMEAASRAYNQSATRSDKARVAYYAATDAREAIRKASALGLFLGL
jgi:hypothetical protein